LTFLDRARRDNVIADLPTRRILEFAQCAACASDPRPTEWYLEAAAAILDDRIDSDLSCVAAAAALSSSLSRAQRSSSVLQKVLKVLLRERIDGRLDVAGQARHSVSEQSERRVSEEGFEPSPAGPNPLSRTLVD
jgi:hypothetical protein